MLGSVLGLMGESRVKRRLLKYRRRLLESGKIIPKMSRVCKKV
jgi:hypothetical protein